MNQEDFTLTACIITIVILIISIVLSHIVIFEWKRKYQKLEETHFEVLDEYYPLVDEMRVIKHKFKFQIGDVLQHMVTEELITIRSLQSQQQFIAVIFGYQTSKGIFIRQHEVEDNYTLKIRNT